MSFTSCIIIREVKLNVCNSIKFGRKHYWCLQISLFYLFLCSYVVTSYCLKFVLSIIISLQIFLASESKAEMKASIWRIPCDFDSSDDSSHSSLELVCHLDNADYGDMKRYQNGIRFPIDRWIHLPDDKFSWNVLVILSWELPSFQSD